MATRSSERPRALELVIHTVLVGWELGAGRGHLEPLKPIMQELANKGCRLVLAVRDRRTARSVFGSMIGSVIAENDLLQAPIFVHKASPQGTHLGSMADSLAHNGFADPALLGPVVRAWVRLLDSIKPNAVLAEFAPSLRMAAYGRAPVVMLGSGWTIPPDTSPLGVLPFIGTDVDRAARAEEGICRAISMVAGCDWQPDRLSSVLRGEATFVMCPAQLDPYRASRRERTWCPPNATIFLRDRSCKPPCVVAYLAKDHPAHLELIKAVSLLKLAGCFYFGGAHAGAVADVIVSGSPVDLNSVLPQASCVVHHGGLGMSTACLINGIPQVVMPHDLEKQANAMSVRDCGAGMHIHSDASAGTISDAILASFLMRRTIGIRASLPAETTSAVCEWLTAS